MLPKVVEESTVRVFKFWFCETLQDGMHLQNELYYRLKQANPEYRTRLYQLACKLTQKGADVVLTVGEQNCSLWASIRSSRDLAHTVSRKMTLPANTRVLSDRVS